MKRDPCPVSFQSNQDENGAPFLRMFGEGVGITGGGAGCRAFVSIEKAHHARELAQQLRGAADALVEYAEAQERKAVPA